MTLRAQAVGWLDSNGALHNSDLWSDRRWPAVWGQTWNLSGILPIGLGLYLEMRYGNGLSNEDGSTQSVTFVRKLTCDMHS